MRVITKLTNKGKKNYTKLKEKDRKEILLQCKNKYVLTKFDREIKEYKNG